MTCFLDQTMLLDCLSPTNTLTIGDSNRHDDADQVDHDQGIETIMTSSSPQSPVSTMADLSCLLVDKNNSYKEVIDYYYSPQNEDPYYRDRLRKRREEEYRMRLRSLSLESIFDKQTAAAADNDNAAAELEMEWSDDEDDEPRGLVFVLDDCSTSTGNVVTGMDCSSMSWSSFSSALCQEEDEPNAMAEHDEAPTAQ